MLSQDFEYHPIRLARTRNTQVVTDCEESQNSIQIYAEWDYLNGPPNLYKEHVFFMYREVIHQPPIPVFTKEEEDKERMTK